MTFTGNGAERSFEQPMHQIEHNLLHRVEGAILFQVRSDGARVYSQILHFTTIADAPVLVKSLAA